MFNYVAVVFCHGGKSNSEVNVLSLLNLEYLKTWYDWVTHSISVVSPLRKISCSQIHSECNIVLITILQR